LTRSYIVTKDAEADLRDITEYTVEKWGAAQCRTYTAELEKAAEAIAKGEGVFKDMNSVLPGLRVATCGKHYIFCVPQQDAPSLILAILHERMDLIARLKNRLQSPF